MDDNHLTYLKIENFKKFECLEVKDIGQFNLIVGDNNVGKTCLLEALLFDEDNLRWIANLHSTINTRGIWLYPTIKNNIGYVFPKESYFEYLVRDINRPIQINFTLQDKQEMVSMSVEYKNIAELNSVDFAFRKDSYTYKDLVHWLKFSKNGEFEEIQFMYRDNVEKSLKWGRYIPFISFNEPYNSDIDIYLNTLGENGNGKHNNEIMKELSYSHKLELINVLNKIFNLNIVDYETKLNGDNPILYVAEKDKKYIPITVYGDGFGKIFRYVVEIMYLKTLGGSRIMIDEIDTGIHYSKMKEFWKAIIYVCKEKGVQLFATTHSKGCMEALIEATDETNKEDVRLIKLREYKDKTIKAITFTFNEFEYLIESETETR